MTYTPTAIINLIGEKEKLEERRRQLMLQAGRLNVSSAKARKILFEGALRRLLLIIESISIVFDTIPPSTVAIPPRKAITLATICLHAHVLNVYGFLDCLAHIWVIERNVLSASGAPLPRQHVGLRSENSTVRRSLPEELNATLNKYDGWFDGLERYRHSLAHRVPLYIPPSLVDPSKREEYQVLNRDWNLELDDVRRSELQTKMDSISHFKSIMLFDLDESDGVFFHAQMVADFLTITSIATKLFAALSANKPQPWQP